MTRSHLAGLMALFMATIVVGFFLGTYLDQRFTAVDYDTSVTAGDAANVGSPALASDDD
jgi:hypothetical protein